MMAGLSSRALSGRCSMPLDCSRWRSACAWVGMLDRDDAGIVFEQLAHDRAPHLVSAAREAVNLAAENIGMKPQGGEGSIDIGKPHKPGGAPAGLPDAVKRVFGDPHVAAVRAAEMQIAGFVERCFDDFDAFAGGVEAFDA